MRYFLLLCLLVGFAFVTVNPLFVDVSTTAGTGDRFSNNNGIAIGDFDDDGLEDMFVSARSDDNMLFRNQGDGTFQDVIEETGIALDGLTMTSVWGDIDNDGDLDLFVGNYSTAAVASPSQLYLNEGDGTFTNISASAGITSNNATRSVHMADVNLDGYVDIYVCNLFQQNILWQSNGDNTFTNRTAASGLFDTNISMGAVFFDYDNDGDQDIYLTHDADQPNIMYENNGNGVFTNVSASTGLNVAGQGMGVDIGDINNDGFFDIYVTNLGANFLLLNDGAGHFTEIAEMAGVTDPGGMGWGCFFIDYDNDGWEDIYVINDSNFSPATNKLYQNNGDSTFTLVSENSATASFLAGRGGTWADFNDDGYLEMIIANGQTETSVQLFENQNTANNWIGFDLSPTTVAADAFGTRIQLQSDQGLKIDEKTAGSSYASQTSHKLYFGLGQGEATDILITWPDGSYDYFASLPINQVHTIEQGTTELPDADEDGFSFAEDCDDNNAAINPGATEIIYNGIDDDCNPLTRDDDLDGDGFLLADDCDDENAAINPGRNEVVYNGMDDDCDPLTRDNDLDGDGFLLADDCDDENAAINPSATEVIYNGVDDDCDPLTRDDDLDGDGFFLVDDCNDDNAAINPGTPEVPYNGTDDDCDPLTPDDDLDGDGFPQEEDCNDLDAAINPGEVDVPNNGVDEDCDGGDLITSTDEQEIAGLRVFPNPTSRWLQIATPEGLEYIVRLVDIRGAVLLEERNPAQVDLGSYPKGIYLLHLNDLHSTATLTKRIVIQ